MQTKKSPNDWVDASTGFDQPQRPPGHVGTGVHCVDCSHRAKCVAALLPAHDATSQSAPFNARLALSPRQTLCREGEDFASVYAIRSGALKSLITSEDGRQQIVAIHLPGETIGAEGIASGHRSRTVIAIEATEVCVIAFAGLDRLMREIPAVQRWFQHALSGEMTRGGETARRLRCTSAEERIASFLLDLSRRLSPTATAALEFRLAVSRGDIAFHLGLTRETVSRAFAMLRRMRLIDGDLTRVRLCDPVRLGSLAACRDAARSASNPRCGGRPRDRARAPRSMAYPSDIDNCHSAGAMTDDDGMQTDCGRASAPAETKNEASAVEGWCRR